MTSRGPINEYYKNATPNLRKVSTAGMTYDCRSESLAVIRQISFLLSTVR